MTRRRTRQPRGREREAIASVRLHSEDPDHPLDDKRDAAAIGTLRALARRLDDLEEALALDGVGANPKAASTYAYVSAQYRAQQETLLLTPRARVEHRIEPDEVEDDPIARLRPVVNATG